MKKILKPFFKKNWNPQLEISVSADNPEIVRCYIVLNAKSIDSLINRLSQVMTRYIVRINQFGSVDSSSHFQNAQASEQTFYIFNGQKENPEYVTLIEENFPKDIFSHPEIMMDIKSQTVILTLYQNHESLAICCRKENIHEITNFYNSTLESECDLKHQDFGKLE